MILFVAPLDKPESTAWLILKAMRNAGLDVEEFPYRDKNRFNSLEEMNNELESSVKELYWTDILFVIKGEGIYPDIIKNTKAKTALWWFDFDALNLPEGLKNWTANFDFVFLTCYPWSNELRELGINAFHLPQATDPAVYHPENPVEEYMCDVAFIGSNKPGREEILYPITKEYNVKIFGTNWPFSKPVYLNEFNKACSSAKLILNITKSDNWPIYENTFSQRVYMVMSTASYLATDVIPGMNLRWLACYDSIDSLKGIIESALKSHELRKQVGKKAREEILRWHTYNHRIQEIIKCLRL